MKRRRHTLSNILTLGAVTLFVGMWNAPGGFGSIFADEPVEETPSVTPTLEATADSFPHLFGTEQAGDYTPDCTLSTDADDDFFADFFGTDEPVETVSGCTPTPEAIDDTFPEPFGADEAMVDALDSTPSPQATDDLFPYPFATDEFTSEPSNAAFESEPGEEAINASASADATSDLSLGQSQCHLSAEGSYEFEIARQVDLPLGDITEVALQLESAEHNAISDYRLIYEPDNVHYVDTIGRNAHDWEAELRENGVIYLGPLQPGSSEVLIEANADTYQCGEETAGGRILIRLMLSVVPGYHAFVLAGSVRPGAVNYGLDVARVQQRLRYFGFPAANSDKLEVNGRADASTGEAIRLFQAVIHPNQQGHNAGNPRVTSDGVVDADGPTLRWLNAANAPRWIELLDPTAGGDFDIFRCEYPFEYPCADQHERFGSSWAIDTVHAAAAAAPGTQIITALSENGYTAAHAEHKSGMDIDVDIMGDNSIQGMQPALTAGEQRVVADMVAFYENATVPVVNIWVGYGRIVEAFNQRVGASIAHLDPGSVHDNHFHVDLAPPSMEPFLQP